MDGGTKWFLVPAWLFETQIWIRKQISKKNYSWRTCQIGFLLSQRKWRLKCNIIIFNDDFSIFPTNIPCCNMVTRYKLVCCWIYFWAAICIAGLFWSTLDPVFGMGSDRDSDSVFIIFSNQSGSGFQNIVGSGSGFQNIVGSGSGFQSLKHQSVKSI